MAEATNQGPSANLANYRPTKFFTKHNHERKWLLIDAEGQRVGRLATKIAMFLRGKHKPSFTPHDDVGDFVAVINCEKAIFHGNEKSRKKNYYKHTGYKGGLKTRSGDEMFERAPHKVIELAVKGMMPRGPLGRKMRSKLKVYAGAEHPHRAQNPEPVNLDK